MATYSSYKPGAGVSSLTAGTGTYVSTTTGFVTVWTSLNGLSPSGTTSTFTIANNTPSTSTTTGALVVTGGVGIGGVVNIGGPAYINGSLVVTSSTLNQYVIQTSIFGGTDISVNTNTGVVTVSDISTLQSVTTRGASSDRVITLSNTSTSAASTSGALIVAGGVGIGGDVNIGGNVFVPGILTVGSVKTQLIVNTNSLDPLNSATIVLNSLAAVGYSGFTIKNSAASGQSYTFDVGGNNRNFTSGAGINEGNLTIFDNVAGVYRLILSKTTGNVIIGGNASSGLLSTLDNGALLQVKGTISANTASITTFSTPNPSILFQSPVTFQTTATFQSSLAFDNTTTFRNTVTFQGTATFNTGVVYERTLLETVVTTINTDTAVLIDSFSAQNYRSCKSIVQIEDPGVNYQLTEIVLLIDGSGSVYKSEYGIISTSGVESGSFSADFSNHLIRLFFTANSTSTKTVTVTKTAMPRYDLTGIS
jgi:hypothetical protein